MTYERVNWKNNGESGATPINKDNLNNMDEGIANSFTTISNLYTALGLNTDTYESTETYAVDDMVVYNNTLYSCNTADTTGTWDSTKWDIVPVLEESEE